jgi:AbrB family looped-hinge helix DNA binding protein
MVHELVRLRGRNQLTLPAVIAEKLQLKPGSLLELIVSDQDTVELRHARVVVAGTPEAKREEGDAEEDIHEGRYKVFGGSKDVREHMRQQRSQQAAQLAAQEIADKIEALQEQMNGFSAELSHTRTVIENMGVGQLEQKTSAKG